ncbi:pyrophosphatase PpaX [Salsuginibacillus halophilus]|uniref:Pyrophosphatase PpaX n=1 Tax=Salsuginibacillus halophilus TaxID=517424 RepID=A0A2P8H946_9BACI|nr:pyrophosphatase PpaX [Salsuginibacillus halophilus]PSL42756.1 pyrophosphatase PpaX [Salsuginibacillus halophilus]
MDINTILFDLDGTLINTNELIISSFDHTLHTFGYTGYAREDIIPFIGPPLDETFKSISPERAEEMVEAYRKHNVLHHDDLIEEYEGVRETIEALAEQGFKLAIVTTKRVTTAHMGLRAAGLDRYFSTVITYNDVDQVKPNPEPLHKAMEELEAMPEQTLMVGDSHHDVLGGKNAGVKTAGVAWSIKGRDALQAYEPDVMLEKMPDLLEVVKDGRA